MPRRGDGISYPNGRPRIKFWIDRPDGSKTQKTKRFPKDTTRAEMKAWRKAQEGLAALRLTDAEKTPTVPGSFRDHAAGYLRAVSAMPTYKERAQHIAEWCAVFGDRARHLITSAEISAQLHTWRSAGRAASTVNHRRTALMHLYSVLDGRSGRNPVRDTPKFSEPDPEPRAVRAEVVGAILHSMGDTDSRARLMVMATTGIPGSSLGRIKPEFVDWEAGTVFVPGRQKGKRTKARVLPLTRQGLLAFQAIKSRGAWGPFSHSSLHKAFRRACDAAVELKKLKPEDIMGVRPYDLRHAFGTSVYLATGDIRATQILMGHSSEKLTHRYTLGAVDARLALAVGMVPALVPDPKKPQ